MRITELKNLLSLSDKDVDNIKRIYGATSIDKIIGAIPDAGTSVDITPQLGYFTTAILDISDHKVFVAYTDADDYDTGKYLFSTKSELIGWVKGHNNLTGISFTKEVIYSITAVELNNKDIMVVCAMNNEYPVAAVSIIGADGTLKIEAIGFSKPKGCNDLKAVLLETGDVVVTYTETLSLDQPIMLAILSEQGGLVQKPILLTV